MAGGSAVVGTLRALLTLDSAQFEQGIRNVGRSAQQWSRDMTRMGAQARTLGTTLSTALTLPIVGLAGTSLKAAIDFESSFAGVRKTVDATEEEFGALQEGLRGLSREIPINVNEINRIGEAAGQLGIKTDNIIGFTEVMAKLGVATNLTSEQAATSLARLANITQMPQTEFDRLGSTIVALGNNFATTEAEIVEFGLRIAGAGAQVGLSEAEILAFGTALSSVGISAEAGGTAISKVFIELASRVGQGGDKLAEVARLAGMTSEEFQRAFKDDAALATTAFIEGLGRVSEAGGNVFGVIEDLGMSEVRLRDALLRASGAGDVLRQSILLGNEAWAENNALTTEANERFKTAESQLALFWQRIQDVAITLGGALIPVLLQGVDLLGNLVPLIEGAVNWFAGLPEPVQKVILGMGGLAAAIGPVLFVVGQLITSAGAIAGIFASGSTAATVLAGAVSLLTGPIGIAAAAIAGLGAVWVLWGDEIATSVANTYAAVKEWLWDKLEPVLAPLMPLLEAIGEMFQAFGALVIAVGQKIAKLFIARMTDEWKTLSSFLDRTIGAITRWIGTIPDALLPLLGPIGLVVAAFRNWSEITQIASSVYTGVKTWLVDRFQSVVDSVKGKVEAVTGFFRDMYDAVVGNSFVPDMVTEIRSSFGELQAVMVDPAGLATSAVSRLFGEMQGSVGGILGGLERMLGDTLGRMVEQILGSSGVFQSAWSTVMTPSVNVPIPGGGNIGVPNPVYMMGKEWLESFLTPITPLLPVSEAEARAAAEAYFGPDYERYTDGIDWGNVLPGQIPGLAQGGVVMPQPGGSIVRVAEAGVPEAIVPLSKIGGSGNMQISIVTPDGNRVAEWLIPFMAGAEERLAI